MLKKERKKERGVGGGVNRGKKFSLTSRHGSGEQKKITFITLELRINYKALCKIITNEPVLSRDTISLSA